MNKKKLILPILAVIGLIVITISVTVAFFNYAKSGSTENTITSSSLTFIYEEVNRIGNGIGIEDALPMSDTEGKAQTNYFDFKITSTSASTIAIPYEITARVVDGSDDIGDSVKVYLTKVSGANEEQKVLNIFDDLDDSTNVLASQFNDKTLYEDEIPAGSSNFVENYRLRMWLDSSVDFSDGTLNNKEFNIKINVYANGEQATQQKIASANSVGIDNIAANNQNMTLNTDTSKNYDYYLEVPEGTTQLDLDITTSNPNESVTIENISAAEANELKQLSTSKKINLVAGDNYLKITVTSANRKYNEIYIIKIAREKEYIYNQDFGSSGRSVDNNNPLSISTLNENSITYEFTGILPTGNLKALFSFGGSNTIGGCIYISRSNFKLYANGTIINETISVDENVHHFAIVMTQSDTKLYVDNEVILTGAAGTISMRNAESIVVGYNQSENRENWSDGIMYDLTITEKPINSSDLNSVKTLYHQDFGSSGRSVDNNNSLSINTSNENSITYEFIAKLPSGTNKALFSFGGSNSVGGCIYISRSNFKLYAKKNIVNSELSIDENIHHFAIVMTQSDTKLYVDGELLVTGNTGTFAMRNAESIVAGYNQSESRENWSDGIMYELLITDKELTPSNFGLSYNN